MRDQLLSDFFKRNLTEDEKVRLGEMLESSSDAADRFAQLAEEDYRASGYPDPLETGKSPLSFLKGHGLALLGALLGLALIVGVGKMCFKVASVNQVAVPATTSVAIEAPVEESEQLSEGRGVSRADEKKTSLPQLKVTLPSVSRLSIDIFGPDGQGVRHLVGGVFPGGVHRFPWDEKDDRGRRVTSGVYRAVILRGKERTEVSIQVKP